MESRGDEAQRGAVAVALGDRVEGDCADDAPECGEDLEHGADRYPAAVAGTEDEVRLGEDVGPEPELDGDREDEGSDVGDAGDQCRLPHR